MNGLNCIRRIIKFINYKGVRDILGILLSKIALIPNKSSTPISKQINALYNLIEYILDRDSKLLPAYLILDEIQKKSLAIVWQNGHWVSGVCDILYVTASYFYLFKNLLFPEILKVNLDIC